MSGFLAIAAVEEMLGDRARELLMVAQRPGEVLREMADVLGSERTQLLGSVMSVASPASARLSFVTGSSWGSRHEWAGIDGAVLVTSSDVLEEDVGWWMSHLTKRKIPFKEAWRE